jgi:pimeloyl-ACP methyl ester carboxylesterase
MTRDTHLTAPTQFVEAGGIRFAYRRFGQETGVPLVFLQHFRGGMDHWDPAVTDGFAATRPVILFDNAGVAASSGETPSSVAQTLALRHPAIVRRLVLVGTRPRGGEPSQDAKYAEYAAMTDSKTGDAPLEAFLYLFFRPSDTSQAAGKAFWKRRHQRKEGVDPPSSPQTMAAQRAGLRWAGQAGSASSAEPLSLSESRLPMQAIHCSKSSIWRLP